MISRSRHGAEDFDERGLLKVPVLFWCGLVLLCRAWWLTGLAMATERGGQWITPFYPDVGWQVQGLVAGVPAMAMLFCYPVRGDMPALARVVYVLMLLSVVVVTCGDGVMASELTVALPEPGWLALCADLACLVCLWPDARLRAVFFGQPGIVRRH